MMNGSRPFGGRLFLTVAFLFGAIELSAGADDWPQPEELKVLPASVDGAAPSTMMQRYFTAKVDAAAERWQKRFETLDTIEHITAYQKDLRERFRAALGEFPQPAPLNPRKTGTLRREGYRVEKIIFESRPKHFVTALCFVPEADKYEPPYPAVLVPCGHAREAKAYESYQTMGALLADCGMVTLVFDPIEQGERLQLVDENGKARYWGVRAHNRIGVGCVLLGQNTATFEVYDGMRGIDYLQSRDDVDPERIACTGNSGGGTQTSYLMALEDRIKVAAPSCYLTNFQRLVHTIGGQDAEQNIFGQLAFGMDHADYVIMRAPSPVMIAAGVKDFFDIEGTRATYASAKKLFTRLGAADSVALFENDAGHNYNRDQRQAIAGFITRFLQNRREPVVEPDIKVFSKEELLCTPRGQVMLLDGARSVYDINADRADELAAVRRKLWSKVPGEEMLEKVRRLAGVPPLDELPEPDVEEIGTLKTEGCAIEKLIYRPEAGIHLPALRFVPEKLADKRPVLYLSQDGMLSAAAAGGPIAKLVGQGRIVLAVDLRGCGETRRNDQKYFKPEYGGDGRDVTYAYLLGKSYVGLRCQDVLVCARVLAREDKGTGSVELIAAGNLGVVALHAAALEPKLFSAVTTGGTIRSWTEVVKANFTTNQMISAVHGALRVYDLPDLAGLIGKKVSIEDPAGVD